MRGLLLAVALSITVPISVIAGPQEDAFQVFDRRAVRQPYSGPSLRTASGREREFARRNLALTRWSYCSPPA